MTLDESAGFGMERLILDQVAEKDLLHRADSRVYIEGDGPDQIKVSIIVFQRDQASFLVHYVSFIFLKIHRDFLQTKLLLQITPQEVTTFHFTE